MASRLGPAHPRGITWNGAGAWLIFSQSRQENFSRTVSITLLTRHRFQRSGYVFAELAQATAAAAFARRRRIDHNPLARKVVWERVALSALARKSDNLRRFGDCLLRRQFVFRRVGFQFFEGKRQLVDQPRRALRFLAVNLALELCYPQGLLHNQRGVFRRLCPRYRQLRFQRGVFFGKSGAIS